MSAAVIFGCDESGSGPMFAAMTTQVWLFSNPKPSPSESLAALTQSGLVTGVEGAGGALAVCVELAGADSDVTRQVWLFSNPKPSPSESLAALTQSGLVTGVDGAGGGLSLIHI